MLNRFNNATSCQKYVERALTYGVPIKNHGDNIQFKNYVEYQIEKTKLLGSCVNLDKEFDKKKTPSNRGSIQRKMSSPKKSKIGNISIESKSRNQVNFYNTNESLDKNALETFSSDGKSDNGSPLGQRQWKKKGDSKRIILQSAYKNGKKETKARQNCCFA